MIKSLIIGAGSIGNHLANAARARDWDVSVFDIDNNALNRMKNEIYPSRYNNWDPKIKLIYDHIDSDTQYDVIFIGTPPDTHVKVAINILNSHSPKILFIEKPLCSPDSQEIDNIQSLINEKKIECVVGYNHNLTANTQYSKKIILEEKIIGTPISINVHWQEHWDGIFKAHPWLNGPMDSYLGYSDRGGGATGEHSHGIALFLYFSDILGFDKPKKISSTMKINQKGNINYDEISNISFISDEGYLGYVIQDVVSSPFQKKMRIQGDNGFLEWHANYNDENDAVIFGKNKTKKEVILFKKTRQKDFVNEIIHIEDLINKNVKNNIISFDRAIYVMRVIFAAYKSNNQLKTINIKN